MNRIQEEYERRVREQRHLYQVFVVEGVLTIAITAAMNFMVNHVLAGDFRSLPWVLAIVGGGIFLLALAKAASMDDRIHECKILGFHIHDKTCKDVTNVRVSVQNKRSVFIPATWGSSADVVADVVDYEETLCDSCHTITIWRPGELPVLAADAAGKS